MLQHKKEMLLPCFLITGLHLPPRKLGGTANAAEGTRYHLERTTVDMRLQLAPFQPFSLALVRAVHRELVAYRVVLIRNDIACVVVAAVLAGGRSLATVTLLVLLHPSASNVLTTAEGTRDENEVASPPHGIKVFL